MAKRQRTPVKAVAGSLLEEMLAKHGELLSGPQLMRCLGFRSARAFSRAAVLGHVPVKIFQMEGRRGWFARTRDVCAWLTALGEPDDLEGAVTAVPTRKRRTAPDASSGGPATPKEVPS